MGAGALMHTVGCGTSSPASQPGAGTAEPLHYLTLQEIARRIESRDLSPVDLTERMLDRIATADRHLKSYATVMREEALAAARAAEQDIRAGKYRGPLHGVPVAVKDLCYTKGVRTMGGTTVRENFIPDADATVETLSACSGSLSRSSISRAWRAAGNRTPLRDVDAVDLVRRVIDDFRHDSDTTAASIAFEPRPGVTCRSAPMRSRCRRLSGISWTTRSSTHPTDATFWCASTTRLGASRSRFVTPGSEFRPVSAARFSIASCEALKRRHAGSRAPVSASRSSRILSGPTAARLNWNRRWARAARSRSCCQPRSSVPRKRRSRLEAPPLARTTRPEVDSGCVAHPDRGRRA